MFVVKKELVLSDFIYFAYTTEKKNNNDILLLLPIISYTRKVLPRDKLGVVFGVERQNNKYLLIVHATLMLVM